MSKQSRTYKAVAIDSEIVERVKKFKEKQGEKDFFIRRAAIGQLIQGLLSDALQREGF
ncbi:3-hydroxybutyryl-CoA dehydrogenase [Providencia huaxiensis]|uniref:3-hydroxybutyryl-CoA dehydrogenase n=1 Tax=Providencia rettgeri TaxID=587 RepID=A0AB35LE19_PRORE|nr:MULTISPECIES: 3-hydroxybutyryl-CoA dehydrogenase [Providencia]ELR5143366.1 3-hydroxybutyryl-CoA dehydrogenase [Providencia stuartii]ELR5260331.1 3-hydroxybutyryl-CoA dehydrogenase [Providencia rettgeri]EMB3081379.1 3-hydroxybutyryl-CoA dehydrogenase [Providencia rettgeri]MBO8255856.1 3-hydroxybutyryl-CoA dehydrogenase [Providencia rettgeri]MBO8259757.1 3-hydroxybutyryl-CoA dehydrogenase [Providencia rettgeri]